MATAKVPISLDKGLDLSSPPMAKRPGSLISCLNYEFTPTQGTRRIDGYERYDGWINGSAVDYWGVQVTLTDATSIQSAYPGSVIYSLVAGAQNPVGVFVSYNAGLLIYVPIKKSTAVLAAGTSIIIDGNSTQDATCDSASSPRYLDLTSVEFAEEARQNSIILREPVAPAPHDICGLHWFRNNLLEVRDAPFITFEGVANTALNNGDVFRIGGKRYMVIYKLVDPLTVYVEPYGDATTNTASIVVLGKDGTTLSTATPTSYTLSAGADWAYMVAINTQETSLVPRTEKRLQRSVIAYFINGQLDGGRTPVAGDTVTVGTGADTYKAYIKDLVVESGDWNSSTAAGRATLVPADPLSNAPSSGAGSKNTINDAEQVYGVNGNAAFFIQTLLRTFLPGSNKLRARESHYMFKTYNLYASTNSAEAYGVSGAGRAVWAKAYTPSLSNPYFGSLDYGSIPDNFAYGTIFTNQDEELDKPKWVSLHAGSRLALGQQNGEVALSVVGEPANFSGILGADVVALGDEMTGMLEGVGDTTFVFGLRSIRKITGTLSEQLAMSTVSGNSGALPYTCVLVGRTPVFSDHSGITSLEQSETYSDFIGKKMSDIIDADLRPRILADFTGTEIGGAYCAIPVRRKNQYRLFLRSGRVYSMCITDSGPLFGLSNYSNDDSARVPFAWSSEIKDTGQEALHVVWDAYTSKTSPSGTGPVGEAEGPGTGGSLPPDPAPDPILLSKSPASASGSETTGLSSTTVTSNSVTVTATGGTAGPKTYAWTKVSGSTLTVGSPSSATTNFSSTVSSGTTKSAVYRCTVSEPGVSSSIDVSVTLQHIASIVPLSASASPSSVSGTATTANASTTVTSGSATVTPANGTGAAKTYSWAKVSGSTLTVASPSSATTSFSSSVNSGTTKSAVYRCTVSDGTYTATADVSISLEHISSVVPLSATADPTSVSGSFASFGASGTATTGSTTVTPANGSGGAKTYSWTKVSGDTVTITSPTSATTTFSGTVGSAVPSLSGVYRCTVSDGTYTASADVNVFLNWTDLN